MARDLGFWRLMSHQVRYEGTPGLWHALLWVLAHAGLPYGSMAVLSIALAAMGAWLFARFAPFPVWIRALTPFTFYFCYQFAVVARSYALEAPLTFAALHLIREHPRRRAWLAIVLGLLANANVFGLFLSAALVAVLLLGSIRRERGVRITDFIAPAIVYAACIGCALAVAWPPKDVGFAPDIRVGRMLHIETGARASATARSDADEPGVDIVKPRTRLEKIADDITFVARTAGAAVLGVLFLAALAWLIFTRREFAAVLPPVAIFVAFRLILVLPHHYGLMFLALVASAWLAWPDRRTPVRRYPIAALACGAVLTLLCCQQLFWTAKAVAFDIRNPYDGSKACAQFLKTRFSGAKVFGYDYWTVAIAPYFRQTPFANQPSAYWDWSYGNHVDQDLFRLRTDRPDAVVLSWRTAPDTPSVRRHGAISSTVKSKEEAILNAGYRPIRTFAGTQPSGRGTIETVYFEVFARASS